MLHTLLTDWCLQPCWKVFIARYALIPYIKQITLSLSKVKDHILNVGLIPWIIKWKYFALQGSPVSERALLFGRLPTFNTLSFRQEQRLDEDEYRALNPQHCKWERVVPCKKISQSFALSTINVKWTDPWSYPDLYIIYKNWGHSSQKTLCVAITKTNQWVL